ncbi:predicted protein [Histoplasma mississippiense (nom. inval.)]|uniref:predicted protein n=1 Tax=Ajellomyces capsulatus (strain NAm1 / WU24) TaxID=2059318 RepID=UPI000157BF4C|nr:predicted protein [Histoplasma mississippiense (nom. inval.)]EDN06497.1 predicted protein [Histoplasma mississippiense (nom. inval.)]
MPRDRDIYPKLLAGYSLRVHWNHCGFDPSRLDSQPMAKIPHSTDHGQRPSVPSAYVAHSVYAPRSFFPHVATPAVLDLTNAANGRDTVTGSCAPFRHFLQDEFEIAVHFSCMRNSGNETGITHANCPPRVFRGLPCCGVTTVLMVLQGWLVVTHIVFPS